MGTPGVELRMGVNYNMGVGIQNLGPPQEQSLILTAEPYFQFWVGVF